MEFLMLTRSVGKIPVFSWLFAKVVDLMGWIMDMIFRVCSSFGIVNVGVCIIIFTLVTKIILLPLAFKQAKSTKLMSIIQPEIKAIQAKYKGRESDQQAAAMMQAEMKAVYEKYGTSMTGGCVQLVIQMPILFALYRVIMNIPAYVGSVKIYFENIVNAIGGEAAIAKVNEFILTDEALGKVVTSGARISGGKIATTDHIIDFLNHLNASQWAAFKEYFSSAADVIAQNYEKISSMNTFLGIDLAASPSSYGFSLKGIIIPVLAGVTQYLSSKFMSPATAANSDDQTAATMKTMTMTMPLMSVFFCWSLASGIGIYWIASAVLMGLQQVILNKYFEKIDTDTLVKQNLEKSNKKRAKKGLPPIDQASIDKNIKKAQAAALREEEALQQKLDAAKALEEKAESYYKLDSITDRANMVQQYENRKKK